MVPIMLSTSRLPGTTLLTNVAIEVSAEVLQCALQGLRRTWRKRAECVPWRQEFRLERELVEIAGLSASCLHRGQNLLRPVQPAPARGAPTARLLGEEVDKIRSHSHRTCVIVEHDHGAGS